LILLKQKKVKAIIRLSQEELKIIKKEIHSIFPDCEIYIFGSVLKDVKGGDIDIYIKVFIEDVRKRRKTKFLLKEKLESLLYKPVDILFLKDTNRPIEQEALKGFKLC
jgi:predicted nucleotidyltransferase